MQSLFGFGNSGICEKKKKAILSLICSAYNDTWHKGQVVWGTSWVGVTHSYEWPEQDIEEIIPQKSPTAL